MGGFPQFHLEAKDAEFTEEELIYTIERAKAIIVSNSLERWRLYKVICRRHNAWDQDFR